MSADMASNPLRGSLASTEVPRQSTTSPQLTDDVVWHIVLPWEGQVVKKMLNHSYSLQIGQIIYIASALSGLGAFYVAINDDIKSSSHGVTQWCYNLMYYTMILLYLAMPVVVYHFLRSVLFDRDFAMALSDGLKNDKNLALKFAIVTRSNIVMIIACMVAFYFVSGMSVWIVAVGVYYTTLFVVPFAFAFGLGCCVLEANRIKATMFLADIKRLRQAAAGDVVSEDRHGGTEMLSIPAAVPEIGTIPGLLDKYYRMHSNCIKTSDKIGVYLLLFFGYALFLAVTTVWGIYLRDVPTTTSIPFAVFCVVIIGELGVVAAATNEVGTLICRETSAYLLYNISACGGTASAEALALIGCLHFAKIEIPFFGNVVVRSRVIVAIMGSVIVAVIPGLILNG